MLAVKTTDLTKKYGKYYGIDNVDLTIEAGEAFGIVGPAGAGKTTLLRLLMNFIFPTSGSGSIFGNDIVSDSVLIKETAGYVPEEVTCYPQMKAGKYIRMAMKLHKVKNNPLLYNLMEAFTIPKNETFDIMDRCDIKATGIAAALAIEPKILLLDEPTADLTRDMRAVFFDLLAKEKEKGTTIIITGTTSEELGDICDRIATMEQGSIVCVKDAAGDIRTQPQIKEEDFSDEYAEYNDEIDELADTIVISDLETERPAEIPLEGTAPPEEMAPVADQVTSPTVKDEPVYTEESIEDFLAEPDIIPPEENEEEEDTVNPKVLKVKVKNFDKAAFTDMGLAVMSEEDDKIKLAYAGDLRDLATKLKAMGINNFTTTNKNIAKAFGIDLPTEKSEAAPIDSLEAQVEAKSSLSPAEENISQDNATEAPNIKEGGEDK